MCGWLLPLAMVCAQSDAPVAEGLRIQVVEGVGAVVPSGAVSARRLVVEVTDGGRAAAGVAVTFRLPEEGVSGRFSSGFQSEMVLTGADGRAAVYGIRWGETAGRLEVRVSAVREGRRGEALIPVEVSATAKESRADRASGEKVKGPGSGGKKWLILAGVAGGAAVGLLAAGGGKSTAPAAVVQPAVVTPTVGVPVISVGRP
jgi:hypothetical protein